jgi:GTP diphosphokinase / guanosine-3',5'-bis(diphosphate) 3'-diphosphatase
MNRRPSSPAGAAAGGDPLAGLLHILAGTRPGADVELIRRAYEIAAYWHQGQERKSGDPYITHPLAVASILAETGADDHSLCAALLHDTVEGTSYTLAALGAGFGTEIASLVAGAMALDAVAGVETVPDGADSAMAAAGSGDTRVLMIKLADRLHNMRTLRHLPRAAQVQKSRQTLEVLVPLARRLRLDTIRAELENLASGTLKRYGLPRATASGRVLAATTALLPAAARARWREEWLGELSVLPTRRERVTFAAQTLRGIARLTVTLHRPAGGKRAYRP